MALAPVYAGTNVPMQYFVGPMLMNGATVYAAMTGVVRLNVVHIHKNRKMCTAIFFWMNTARTCRKKRNSVLDKEIK